MFVQFRREDLDRADSRAHPSARGEVRHAETSQELEAKCGAHGALIDR
jgi:hypothetical protein